MKNFTKVAFAAAMAATILDGFAARAQFVAPPPNNRQMATLQQQQQLANDLASARTQAYVAGATTGARPGYQPPAPVAVYGGGYYTPYQDPYGGYLNGVAAVTNANAQYQVTIQQARLAQSQADLSKLDVRRRIKQEADYEKMMMPNPEQVRLAEMRASLAHSRSNPPLQDIWSGSALNHLFAFAQTMRRQGLVGPDVPLAPDVLRPINVTTGTQQGSTGALNDGKPLKWPITLRTSPYSAEREKIDGLCAELVKQGGSSQGIDVDSLLDAQKTVKKLDGKLRDNVADLTPDEYTGSRRFLTQLTQSLRVLEDPNASNYITKKWSARGNSVAELYDEMSRSGLKFASSVAGDEAAYTTLFSALATYDSGLQRLVSSGPAVRTDPRR